MENSSFDPYHQIFTLFQADGITAVTISASDVDDLYYASASSCILFGAELGASLIMFIVVAVLTKPSKRKTLLYSLNLLSLFLSFLRSLLLSVFYTGPWSEFYAVFGDDYSAVPRSAYATSIAGNVIPLLLTISVNASLVLQAHVVCKNLEKKMQHLITGITAIVFLLAVGFRFAQTIEDSLAVMTAESFYYLQWIHTGALVTETISIWYFSIIFTSKLLFTLYTRKRNGWKQWSAVRVLAAMGGCTMVLPSIFAILEYTTIDQFPQAGTLALTMVPLLLPLSSLWAGMVTDSEAAQLNLANFAKSHTASSRGMLQTGSTINSRKLGSISLGTFSRSQTQILNDGKPTFNPASIDTVVETQRRSATPRDSTDMDLEAMGIRVDHSYGVRKGSYTSS